MNVKFVISLIMLFLMFGCIDEPNYFFTDVNLSDSNFTNLRDTPGSYSSFNSLCVKVNSDENGLVFGSCAAGGGGTVYTGILPIAIDNDANKIRLDINAQSDWTGLFDGFDSNEFVLWVDGNLNFVRQVDGNQWYVLVEDSNDAGRLDYTVIANPPWGSGNDTTLDINVNALFSFLSKSYDWNADQNFISVNIEDLNLFNSGFILNNDLNYSLADLNLSVYNVCAGDSNSFLNNVGECIKTSDLNVGLTLQQSFDLESGTRYIVIGVGESLDLNLGFGSPSGTFIVRKDGGNAKFEIRPASDDFLYWDLDGQHINHSMYSTTTESEFWIDSTYGDITNKDYGLGGDGGLQLDYQTYIIPATDNFIALGNEEYGWKSIYSDGNITTDSNLLVDGNTFSECYFFDDGSFMCSSFPQDLNDVFVPRIELVESADANAGSNIIGVPSLNGIDTLTESMIVFNSAGRVSGGIIIDALDAGGRDINVSSGTGTIRISDEHDANLLFFSWSDSNNLTIGDENILYVGVEFNAGSPQVVTKTTDVWNFHTEFPLGSAVFQTGVVHVNNDPQFVANFASHALERFHGTEPLERDEIEGGLILGETGTRNITVSQGSLWDRVNKFSISAFDSSNADENFDCYFRDGSGGFDVNASMSQWDNLNYDDGTGTLNNLLPNKFATLWFYLEPDSEVACVYGRNEWATFAGAETEGVPATIPLRLSAHAKLISRLIFQQGASSASEISSVFSTVFSATAVSNHGNLAGLADDDHLQYYSRGDANVIFNKVEDSNNVGRLDYQVIANPPWLLQNIFNQGSYSFDTNSFNIDLNVGGKDIFNVDDFNMTGDANIGGSANVDGNFVVGGSTGRITMAGDQNLFKIGMALEWCFNIQSDGNLVIATC